MSIWNLRCEQIFDSLPMKKCKKKAVFGCEASARACVIMCVPVGLHPCRHANLLAASHSLPEKEVPFRWHFMMHLSPAGVHSPAMGQNKESSCFIFLCFHQNKLIFLHHQQPQSGHLKTQRVSFRWHVLVKQFLSFGGQKCESRSDAGHLLCSPSHSIMFWYTLSLLNSVGVLN